MLNKAILSILEDWTDEFNVTLMKNNSLCVALFSADRKLLFANNSMSVFFKGDPCDSFINPTFDKLLEFDNSIPLIFDGFLTLGDYSSVNTSIVAQVYRKHNHLLVVGGVDTTQLLAQNEVMHQLNSEVSNLQRQLLKEKHVLENTLSLLNQANNVLNEKNEQLNIQTEKLSRLTDYLDITNKELKISEEKYRLQSEELQILNNDYMALNEELKCNLEELTSLNECIVQKNETLDELNATKDKFFSIIAHDLKNPFNILFGFSELLVKNVEKYAPEKVQQFAQHIYDTSRETYTLLENLLEWSRLQTGKLSPIPVKVKPSELIYEVKSLCEKMSKSKNIDLQSIINCDDFIWADKEMIETVLRNLVTNALKFTKPEGKVKIETRNSEKNVLFIVSDTGIGIESGHIGKLFRIDSKLSKKGTANEKGTGLGLILCKEFVEKHGGTIWVESEVGKGSDFKFTIPKIN